MTNRESIIHQIAALMKQLDEGESADEHFGKRVLNLMNERKISRSELATILGVTKQNISVLLGTKNPHFRTIERISALFNVPKEFLAFGVGNKT